MSTIFTFCGDPTISSPLNHQKFSNFESNPIEETAEEAAMFSAASVLGLSSEYSTESAHKLMLWTLLRRNKTYRSWAELLSAFPTAPIIFPALVLSLLLWALSSLPIVFSSWDTTETRAWLLMSQGDLKDEEWLLETWLRQQNWAGQDTEDIVLSLNNNTRNKLLHHFSPTNKVQINIYLHGGSLLYNLNPIHTACPA